MAGQLGGRRFVGLLCVGRLWMPEAVWEWPALAALLLVVGWMLFEQRRATDRMAEERARHEERMDAVVAAMEKDRRECLDAWKGLMREGIEGQHKTAEALAALCVEVEGLREVTSRQFLEIAQVLRAREVRSGKAEKKQVDTGGD